MAALFKRVAEQSGSDCKQAEGSQQIQVCSAADSSFNQGLPVDRWSL